MGRGVPALLATLVLACAAGNPPPEPQPAPPRPDPGALPFLEACDDFFDVLTSARCGGAEPPAANLAAMRSRYERSCVARLTLPGTSWTAERFEACAADGKVLPCDATERPAPCIVLPGGFAEGAPCLDDAQCASTRCQRTFGSAPGQATVVPTCGTCAAASARGEACAGDAAGGCVDGTECARVGGAPVCEAVTYGEAGAPCDDVARACARGTECDPSSATCIALGGPGAACASSEACNLPLACAGGRCAEAGGPGSPCAGSRDCAPGLLCAGNLCVTPVWSAPGEPCGPAAPCISGDCPRATGVCPRLLDDGSACVPFDDTTTCDSFAACTDSRCTLEYVATACP